MENTDSGVQRAEQLCGGHEDTGEKAETALRRAGSRTWAKADAPIPGILQARTLEWVAISFSNA